MKIVHCADLHIGRKKNLGTTSLAIKSMVEKVKVIRPDLVVIAGDIFDSTTTPIERNLFADVVQDLSSVSHVVIVKGNHDRNEDLLIYQKLKPHEGEKKVIVAETPKVVNFMGFKLCLLPHIDKSVVALKSGIDRDTAYSDEIKRWVDMFAEKENKLFFGHFAVVGAKMSNGFDVPKGISLESIKKVGALYSGLGDIHKYQKLDENIYYSGSINRVDFSEVDEKGFILVDVETDGVKAIEFVQVEARRVNTIEYVVSTGEFIDKNTMQEFKIENGESFQDVKLVISCTENELVLFNSDEVAEKIKKLTVGDFYLDMKIIPVSNIRDEEYAKAETLEEKVLHYITTNKVDVDIDNVMNKLSIISSNKTSEEIVNAIKALEN